MQHNDNTGSAEYYALYVERSDGDYELQIVLSEYTLDEFADLYETYSAGHDTLVVESGECDFPSILMLEE